MDNLKKFIDSHKEEFNDVPLPEGHFERFEKKLPVPRRQLPRWIGILTTASAAIIAVLVFIKIQQEISDRQIPQSSEYACETQEEIEELRIYYNMQMDELYTQIRALYKTDLPPGGLELLQETKQVIKTSQNFEEKILPDLPCSEAGLFALNQHYNTSLQSLNIMLKQMEHVIDNN